MSSQPFLEEGYSRKDGQWKLTANHLLLGVTPEEVDWWWDNINSTERYKLWHPTDHISFEWLISPKQQGHIGSLQRVREYLNGFPPGHPSELVIRWEDPKGAEAQYAHVLLATGNDQDTQVKARLMHEYEPLHDGSGTRMRSHFWFPGNAPEVMVASLYQHNRQEMAYLATFLPWLHRAEVEMPRSGAYFAKGNDSIIYEEIADSSGGLHPQYLLKTSEGNVHSGDIVTLVQSQSLDMAQWSWVSA
ncbi:MAG: hypothetical protein JO215_09440 [Ktedonobacteraceae bacterium]|nr:hypothetical protein [Ktedonobacteraceae bacterium]MBV9616871.1 hypothetical protein [Ktedonobacteraceae bacterium]